MQKVQIPPERKLQDQERDKSHTAAASVAAGTTVPQQPQTLVQDDVAHNANQTPATADQGIVPKTFVSVSDPDKSCHTPWSHQERLRIMLSQAREREQQQQALMDQVEQEEAEKQKRYSFEQRHQAMHQEWQYDVDTATAYTPQKDGPELSFAVNLSNTSIEVAGDTTAAYAANAAYDADATSTALSSGEDALGALLAGLGNSVAVRTSHIPDGSEGSEVPKGPYTPDLPDADDASAAGLMVDEQASGELNTGAEQADDMSAADNSAQEAGEVGVGADAGTSLGSEDSTGVPADGHEQLNNDFNAELDPAQAEAVAEQRARFAQSPQYIQKQLSAELSDFNHAVAKTLCSLPAHAFKYDGPVPQGISPYDPEQVMALLQEQEASEALKDMCGSDSDDVVDETISPEASVQRALDVLEPSQVTLNVVSSRYGYEAPFKDDKPSAAAQSAAAFLAAEGVALPKAAHKASASSKAGVAQGDAGAGAVTAVAAEVSATTAAASAAAHESKAAAHNPFHYRGGYMPCYFVYDYGTDRFLLDEGSCRLLGITYTGDWIPEAYIKSQLEFQGEEDSFFAVLFGRDHGDQVFLPVRIKQGVHQGEHLYMTATVVQRDDTGIGLVLSGYFSQLRAPFWASVAKIKHNSSSFDIDMTQGRMHYGYAYAELLGLSDNSELPQTLEAFERDLVHPEDLLLFKRQHETCNHPNVGDYYECVYRLKHTGGYYIWCIDRALVVERDREAKALRVIGTTTNIDVVRSNFERLKRSIYQDPLTGLHNRLYLNTRYKYFTLEESQPLTLVYVDISGLKVINDYLGHAQGDDLVRLAAHVLRDEIYLDHEVVRFSGDEFLLIFPNCSTEQCQSFIDKFAADLERANLNQEYPLPVYFGFGIATLNEIPDGDTFLRCEARADMRLQVYKSQNHDRIYRHLRAYIEELTGQKVDFNDNRTLDYIERQAHNDAETKRAHKGDTLSTSASNKTAGGEEQAEATAKANTAKAKAKAKEQDAISAALHAKHIAHRKAAVRAALAAPVVTIPQHSVVHHGNTPDLTQVSLELKGILDTVLGDEDRNLAVVQNTGYTPEPNFKGSSDSYVPRAVAVTSSVFVTSLCAAALRQQGGSGDKVSEWVNSVETSFSALHPLGSLEEEELFRTMELAFKEGLHSPLADFGMMQQGDLSCPYSSAYRPLKSMPSIGKIRMRQTQSTPSTPHIVVEGKLLPFAPCVQKEQDLVPLSDLDERVLAAEVAYAQNPTIIAEDLNSTRVLEGLVGFNSLVADPVLYGGDLAANSEQSQQQSVPPAQQPALPETQLSPEAIPLMEAVPATSMPLHREWPIGQSVQQTFIISTRANMAYRSAIEALLAYRKGTERGHTSEAALEVEHLAALVMAQRGARHSEREALLRATFASWVMETKRLQPQGEQNANAVLQVPGFEREMQGSGLTCLERDNADESALSSVCAITNMAYDADLALERARNQLYVVQGQLSDYTSDSSTFKRVKAQRVLSPSDNYQIEDISVGHSKITLLGYDESHLNELRLNGELVFTTEIKDAQDADTAAAVSRRTQGRHFEEQA